jgi:polysaccharide biosynthesis/export protein VpsN
MDVDAPRRRETLGKPFALAKVVSLWVSIVLMSVIGTLVADDYRLGAGDEIQIQVYEEDDLSIRLRLDESGVFTYPYLGSITALGRTVAELEQELTRGLKQDILVKPSISVSIVTYRNFYIGGEVAKPGGYPYHPGLTVQQAITVAGGPTEWASSSKFQVLREGGDQPDSASSKTLVRPGDTVTVLEGLF